LRQLHVSTSGRNPGRAPIASRVRR